MTRCSTCGVDLLNSARYCHNCGLPVEKSDAQTTAAAAEPTVADEEGNTVLLPEGTSASDEGATALLPNDSNREDGATTLLSDYGAEDRSTVAVDDLEGRASPASGETVALDDTPDPAEGSTQLLQEREVIQAPHTTALPTEQQLQNESATIALGQAATAKTQPSPSKTGSPFDRDQLLQNRYRRLKILGRGGFGAAFLTEDTKLNRACVIKQLLTFGKSPREVALYRFNFEREAKLLVALNHPGHPSIPEIYDYFSEGDSNYLVMKYIEGRSLQDALDQSHDKLPWREAVRYAIDVCSALDYMHNHSDEPVMHRDVKPANILLGDDGRIWLVDFGLAKANPVADDNDSQEETRAYGTVGYSPLEQWFGQARPASDVYAVGATLHHLVTGVSPLDAYEGKSNILKIKELHGKFTPIREIDPSLSKELEQIITAATNVEPEQRPTPLQLREQLSALISGAQRVALFTFKSGESAQTVPELVDLCEQNRREAEAYLHQGDFERWFLLINRNDLAEAARQAIRPEGNQADNLERFLHLLLPNLFLRRLRKASVRVGVGLVQFVVIAAVILVPLLICGSYIGAWFLQRSIGTVEWPFNTLSVEEENVYSEAFLTEKLDGIAGAYFGNIEVDTRPPGQVDLSGTLWGLPVRMPLTLTVEADQPHFELSTLNDYPLYVVGDTLSNGVNSGVEEAFRTSPVDITDLTIEDEAVVFSAAESDNPARPAFATATPTPTATPSPTPTPTPVPFTLVVISNELDYDIVLEIEGDAWRDTINLAARGTEILEPPSGEYQYVVRYTTGNQIAAEGEQVWTLNKAYRLRIGSEEQRRAIEAAQPGG